MKNVHNTTQKSCRFPPEQCSVCVGAIFEQEKDDYFSLET